MHFIPVSVQSCVENTLTVTIYQCACACAQVCMLKCTNPWHVLLKQNRSRWVFIENCAITSVIPLFIMLKISVIQSYVLPFQIWSLSKKKMLCLSVREVAEQSSVTRFLSWRTFDLDGQVSVIVREPLWEFKFGLLHICHLLVYLSSKTLDKEPKPLVLTLLQYAFCTYMFWSVSQFTWCIDCKL